MKTKRDNRIVFDLHKAQYARFYYRNQHGHVRDFATNDITYEGKLVYAHEMAMFHPDYPAETMLQRLERRGVQPDVWVPEIFFKLTANCGLTFTGDKAVSLNQAWRAYVYNKQKKHET